MLDTLTGYWLRLWVTNILQFIIRAHPFSTYANFFEKICARTKWMIPYLCDTVEHH